LVGGSRQWQWLCQRGKVIGGAVIGGAVIMEKNQVLLNRFGLTVKTLREERGLTQEELAHRAGMTEKHLGEIERAAVEASITAVAAIAKGLQLASSALFPGQEQGLPEPPPRLSRAQWQTIYDVAGELLDAAKHMLGFADAVKQTGKEVAKRRAAQRKRQRRKREGRSTRR
jgi:transcriptional regulator with XRE-family HTH domain